jgi:hypothetical protein
VGKRRGAYRVLVHKHERKSPLGNLRRTHAIISGGGGGGREENKSKFSRHLLDERHPIQTVDNIMKIMYTTKNGSLASIPSTGFTFIEKGENAAN